MLERRKAVALRISAVLFLCCIVAALPDDATAQQTSTEPLAPDFSIGAAVGSPSNIVLVGGVSYGLAALRVSGGSWGDHWDGMQGDVGINFSRTGSLVQNLSFVIGQFETKVKYQNLAGRDLYSVNDEHYFGVCYNVDYSGFLLQVGMASGTGDFPNPQFLFQFGYAFHF